MANAVNIFDRYGIKEVANVYFEALEDDIKAGVYKGDVVLYLDTLKVSTIETTAENTAAQGGWGNPKLVQWDYGKEINVTLEDALMSLESLRFMLGGAIKNSKKGEKVLVRRTAEVVVKNKAASGQTPNYVFDAPEIDGKKYNPEGSAEHPIKVINLGGGFQLNSTTGAKEESPSIGARTQITDHQINDTDNTITFVNPKLMGEGESATPYAGDHLRLFWEEEVYTDENNTNHGTTTAVEVTISPDTFPGTYRVIGDTLIRNTNGKDEPFQFVIEKAKVQSNVTFTLQAEGDPSTFEMTLNVLRNTNDKGENEMMKLIRYGVESSGDASGNDIGSLN